MPIVLWLGLHVNGNGDHYYAFKHNIVAHVDHNYNLNDIFFTVEHHNHNCVDHYNYRYDIHNNCNHYYNKLHYYKHNNYHHKHNHDYNDSIWACIPGLGP